MTSSTTVKTCADQLALRLAVFPSDQAFGHRIHVVDAPFRVGGNHRIANRLQRDLRAFLGLENRGLRLLALGNIGRACLRSRRCGPAVSRTTRLESMTTSMEPSLRRSTYSSLRSSPSASARRTKVSRSLGYQYSALGGHFVQFLGAGIAQQIHEGRIGDQNAAVTRRLIDALHHALEQAAKLRLHCCAGHLRQPRRSMAMPAICAMRGMSS